MNPSRDGEREQAPPEAARKPSLGAGERSVAPAGGSGPRHEDAAERMKEELEGLRNSLQAAFERLLANEAF